jgi:hypothetical protein
MSNLIPLLLPYVREPPLSSEALQRSACLLLRLYVSPSVTELPGKKKTSNSQADIPQRDRAKTVWERMGKKFGEANLFAKERTYLHPGKIVAFESLAEKLATVSSTIRNVCKTWPSFVRVLPPGFCHSIRKKSGEILQRP